MLSVHKPIASRRCQKLFTLYFAVYSRITSTKSPLFGMTTFSVSLTNFTVLLPQSRKQTNIDTSTAHLAETH